jgi:type I restriction enzyme S subunit
MSVPDLRFPEFEREWEESRLDEITDKKISYGIVQAGPHIHDGMPYIKSKDLNGPLTLSKLERTSSAIAKTYQRSEVRPGDIVFSLRGNIGVSQIVPDTISVANLTQGTARISVKRSAANKFVYRALETQKIRKRIFAVMKGSTFQEISLGDLRQIKLCTPSLAEQKKIAGFLGVVDARIAALRDRRAGLERYKRGLMQALFSQRLRFTKPDGAAFPDWEEKRLGDLGKFTGGGTPDTNT